MALEDDLKKYQTTTHENNNTGVQVNKVDNFEQDKQVEVSAASISQIKKLQTEFKNGIVKILNPEDYVDGRFRGAIIDLGKNLPGVSPADLKTLEELQKGVPTKGVKGDLAIKIVDITSAGEVVREEVVKLLAA